MGVEVLADTIRCTEGFIAELFHAPVPVIEVAAMVHQELCLPFEVSLERCLAIVVCLLFHMRIQ